MNVEKIDVEVGSHGTVERRGDEVESRDGHVGMGLGLIVSVELLLHRIGKVLRNKRRVFECDRCRRSEFLAIVPLGQTGCYGTRFLGGLLVDRGYVFNH